MRKYETRIESVEYLDEITCDRCKKIITDELEEQEAMTLRFTGGYSSVFGDGANVEVDICQQCLKELVGDFCRYC